MMMMESLIFFLSLMYVVDIEHQQSFLFPVMIHYEGGNPPPPHLCTSRAAQFQFLVTKIFGNKQ